MKRSLIRPCPATPFTGRVDGCARAKKNRQRPATAVALGLWICALGNGCQHQDAAPLDDALILQAVRSRGDLDLAQAVSDASDIAPLGLPLVALADPADPATFATAAVAWSPPVRAARRSAEAAARRLRSSDGPGRLDLSAEIQDLGDPEDAAELRASVELLSLLGIGTRAAEQDLLAALHHEQAAELEALAWTAWSAAMRAHVEVAALRGERQALAAMAQLAEGPLQNAQRRQSVGTTPAHFASAIARAQGSMAEAILSSQRAELDAVARLAQCAGLSPQAEILAAIPPLDEAATPRASLDHGGPEGPEEAQLLARRPDLRAARRAYAAAEARVRLAAARAYPDLDLGLLLSIASGRGLYGAELALELAGPLALNAEIEAAIVERTRSREVLEDRLREAWIAAVRQRGRCVEAVRELDSARSLRASSQANLQTWRERWFVRRDIEAFEGFAESLEARLATERRFWRALKDHLCSAIDAQEVQGSPSRPTAAALVSSAVEPTDASHPASWLEPR